MFYVVWKLVDGPRESAAFSDYLDAEDFLTSLPAARWCDWKYIERGCD